MADANKTLAFYNKRGNLNKGIFAITSFPPRYAPSSAKGWEKQPVTFPPMVTPHPNLVLIEQFFRAYAANDHAAIRQVLSPGIKWIIPGSHPLSGVKSGIDEVMTFFTLLSKAAFQARPIVMGVNDNFVIDCHHNWSNLSEGPNFSGMSCLLWKIEAGQIVEVHNFPEDQHKNDAFFRALYR